MAGPLVDTPYNSVLYDNIVAGAVPRYIPGSRILVHRRTAAARTCRAPPPPAPRVWLYVSYIGAPVRLCDMLALLRSVIRLKRLGMAPAAARALTALAASASLLIGARDGSSASASASDRASKAAV